MEDTNDLYRDKFWDLIQKQLGLPISMHLKNIFKYSELDNRPALLELKGSGFDFDELEEFVRSDAYEMSKPEGANAWLKHP